MERAAGLPLQVREVHREVLRAFLASGAAPHRSDLQAPTEITQDDALRQLSEVDLVHLGADGRVDVAYPFSGRPTCNVVQLDDGQPLQAMCAIDALGIPLMTGQDALITATDPDTGAAIQVRREGGDWHWAPVAAAVLLAHTARAGSAAACQCPAITFHTSQAGATEHLSNRPELVGEVLDQATAVEIARLTFAALLDDRAAPSRPSEPR